MFDLTSEQATPLLLLLASNENVNLLAPPLANALLLLDAIKLILFGFEISLLGELFATAC